MKINKNIVFHTYVFIKGAVRYSGVGPFHKLKWKGEGGGGLTSLTLKYSVFKALFIGR